ERTLESSSLSCLSCFILSKIPFRTRPRSLPTRASDESLARVDIARALGRCDLDASRLRLRLLRDRHFDDAVASGRLHVGSVDRIRQREAAMEAAIRAFGACALDRLVVGDSRALP